MHLKKHRMSNCLTKRYLFSYKINKNADRNLNLLETVLKAEREEEQELIFSKNRLMNSLIH